MIAVTGASGQLGHLVIESLLQHTEAGNIIAIVRTPDSASEFTAKGVTLRQADYDQPGSLINALQGVNKPGF